MRLFVIRLLTKHLVKVITEDDVLRIVGGNLYLGKVKFSENETAEIREQAKLLLESPLWHFMKRQTQYLATMKMSRQASDTTDIALGNLWFHHLDVQELFLQKLSK